MEKIPNNEVVHTKAEILELFHHMFGGESLMEEQRSLDDEKGLYLLEVRSTDVDSEGYTIELSYMRSGSFSEGKSIDTRIDVVYYDRDGVPVGGRALKIFRNSEWINATE